MIFIHFHPTFENSGNDATIRCTFTAVQRLLVVECRNMDKGEDLEIDYKDLLDPGPLTDKRKGLLY